MNGSEGNDAVQEGRLGKARGLRGTPVRVWPAGQLAPGQRGGARAGAQKCPPMARRCGRQAEGSWSCGTSGCQVDSMGPECRAGTGQSGSLKGYRPSPPQSPAPVLNKKERKLGSVGEAFSPLRPCSVPPAPAIGKAWHCTSWQSHCFHLSSISPFYKNLPLPLQ